MKFPSLSSALLSAGLLLAGSVFPASAATTGPRLTFATNSYDFGKIISGEKVNYTFILTNTGDEALVISNVTPGCHCTTPGEWSHRIEPGQIGKIPLQFDSGAFRGPITRNVLVTSNDKLAPSQTVTLRGEITRAIEISPPMAHIEVMPGDTNDSTVVHLVNQTAEPITLSNAVCAQEMFTAELKTIQAGKSYDLVVTAKGKLQPGNTIGTVTVRTSLQSVPQLSVTIIAVMQSPVVVAPMQLPLPPRLEYAMTNRVRIRSNMQAPLKVTDPSSTDSRITVSLDEVNPGKEFQLTVVFPAGYVVPADKQAIVTAKTDTAGFPAISVPIIQYPSQRLNPPAFHPRPITQNPPAPSAVPVGHP